MTPKWTGEKILKLSPGTFGQKVRKGEIDPVVPNMTLPESGEEVDVGVTTVKYKGIEYDVRLEWRFSAKKVEALIWLTPYEGTPK